VELAAKIPAGVNWTAPQYGEFAIKELVASQQKDMDDFRVKFDRWFYESELYAEKALDKTLEVLKARGKTYEKDGAVWFGSSAEGGDDKDRVLVRQDGRPTYFLADIAYHLNKFNRGFDRLINIWGADHHGYVPRMKAAVKELGYSGESLDIIIHQLVHLIKEGKQVKMSKRAGEFISLRWLIDEAGTDASRFFLALRTPDSHLNFDLDLAKKHSQENPVFYVQYVHARICSIFRQGAEKKIPLGLCAEIPSGFSRLRKSTP